MRRQGAFGGMGGSGAEAGFDLGDILAQMFGGAGAGGTARGSGPGTGGVRYRVYSNGISKIQDRSFDGVDLDFAADDQASFNPRNPRSNANDTKITVIVGTDGDGLGNCTLLTFVQPAGIAFRLPA